MLFIMQLIAAGLAHAASEIPLPQPGLWPSQITPLQTQLQVDEAWGIDPGFDKTTKGEPNVHICVIESGFDLDHDEFERDVYGGQTRDIRLYHDGNDPPLAPRGIYLNEEATNYGKTEDDTFSAESVGRCILTAVNEDLGTNSRRVILLPATSNGWAGNADFAVALYAAENRDDVLIIAPTGNNGDAPIEYPAAEEIVMAVGAVDDLDRRAKDPGEGVVSQYGDNLSVMAPGLYLSTTDLVGSPGYSASDYVVSAFSGSSAAAAHVAGVAALLFSRYPALSANQVRDILERTADKVETIESGETTPYEYTETGTNVNARNQKMGYGRVNAYHALDLADVMISDFYDVNTGQFDDGNEPSTGTGQADIVVTPFMTYAPENDAQFDNLLAQADSFIIDLSRGNKIYVRVRNRGPNSARNVRVIAVLLKGEIEPAFPTAWRIVPEDPNSSDYAFIEPAFQVPDNNEHWVGGNLLSSPLAAESSAIVEFILPVEEAQKLVGWEGQATIAAVVVADNDYVFTQWESPYLEASPEPPETMQLPKRNNLASVEIIVRERTLTADINFDGIVDFKDVATLASQWLDTESWYQN
jgi:hypothetical protein